MPLVTLLDLEKVNQMMNQQQQNHLNNFNDLVPAATSPNMSQLLTQANNIHANQLTHKTNNLFANALLQQIQSQNKLFSNTLILNCIQANAAHLLNAQNTENQKQINYSRYKTELCRQFIENGECKYGDKCQFAHGLHDLKDVNRHPKYKTDYCKTFHSKGFCPYGPRCHFIHELHEKYDPSIQNVSHSSKKTTGETTTSPTKQQQPAESDCLIDKQLEEIQAHLASSLFIGEDSNDHFTVNEAKNQLAGDCDKHNSVGSGVAHAESSSSFSSGSSSPVTVSSSATSSSYASTTNSASVSSCTSPVLNRAIKKPTFSNNIISNKKSSSSVLSFDNTIKNIFDGVSSAVSLEEIRPSATSPLATPRTRSSTSSTSSACSSSSTSSFEFEEPRHLKSVNIIEAAFSPVKQQQQQPIRAPVKNLGPIGRPNIQTPVMRQNNIFDIERINNLLMQQNINQQQQLEIQDTSSSFNSNKSASLMNKNILSDSQKMSSNTGFFNHSTEFNSYGQFYKQQQTPNLDRQSSW